MQLRAGYTELHTAVIPPRLKIGGAQGANHLSFLYGGRARVAGKGRLIKEHCNLKTDSERTNPQMTCKVDCNCYAQAFSGEVY